MNIEGKKRKLAFVVPTLHEAAGQNEDIIQLLLFAAAKLENELERSPSNGLEATIVTVDDEIGGWKHLSGLFSQAALQCVSIEVLPPPATPNLSIASQKPAYNLFEFLKQRDFDEVHCLDLQGLAYYPTQAKLLGLYFLRTVFAVHIVGSSLFREEAEDNLLDNLGTLMDDMLERGSVERADVLYVHDRKAWQWYQDKVDLNDDRCIVDISWPEPVSRVAPVLLGAEEPLSLIYYGSLGGGDGLPLFCDIVGRAFPKIDRPVEVFFVGSSQAVGGMDAVSYIHLRAAKWNVPITIKRDLPIDEELKLIADLNGVVICNTVRRESLRARLLAGTSVARLHVGRSSGTEESSAEQTYPAIPDRVAQALVNLLSSPRQSGNHSQFASLMELWRVGRPQIGDFIDVPPSPPLQIPGVAQPKVSVCVTHFSRPDKLRTALESLKRQTYKNFEVIVVDDGSPAPEVQQELQVIQRDLERMGWQLVVQENRYLGAARNFGARHASGEYLLFMDDDNAAKPNEISTLVAVAQRTGAGLVTTFYDAFETDRDLTGSVPAMRFTPFGSDPTLGILTNCFGDANALYAREVFEQLGGFTEDYGITHEDWEFFCRASLEGVKLVCVPEPLFWYRVDQNGMYRGIQTQLHKNANLRRHIRPFLQKLPPYQARLVQLAQGLSVDLPLVTVGEETRRAVPRALRDRGARRPYARVAVITRTKDRPLLLRRAIRGVLDQTFQDWLLVIVNDGGSPESVEIVVDELADELAGRVLVLHHPVPMGMQTAANAGLTNCESDFIAIHDDDDSWEPTFLARTVSHLDERGWNSKSGGVVTWARVIVEELRDGDEIVTHDNFIFNNSLYNLSLVDLAIENRFPPISFLFRRACLEVVGPFNEQYGVLGDWDFHLRMLRQFDIDVIPEPLANYHHRAKGTSGQYGNSVHVQTDVHQRKRVELLNSVVRGRGEAESGLSLAQLMAFGELHHTLLAEQRKEFQRLHDYIWTLEQRVRYISTQVEQVPGQLLDPELSAAHVAGNGQPLGANKKTAQTASNGHPTTRKEDLAVITGTRRNLVVNGDFRVWPNVGKTYRGPNGRYSFKEISPNLYICYDGRQVSYKVERRLASDNQLLSSNKSYVHIENDGWTKDGSWFALEYNIPSALLVSGKSICISGVSRMKAGQQWILVGGRYQSEDGSESVWSTQRVPLAVGFRYWSCTIACPAIQHDALRFEQRARIVLRLPHSQHFEFDLTDFQIELGTTPTEFQYSKLSRDQRARLFWRQTKSWLKQSKAILGSMDKSSQSNGSV